MLVLAPVYQITYLASKRKEQLRKYGTTFLFKLKLSLISKNKPLASHAEKKKQKILIHYTYVVLLVFWQYLKQRQEISTEILGHSYGQN